MCYYSIVGLMVLSHTWHMNRRPWWLPRFSSFHLVDVRGFDLQGMLMRQTMARIHPQKRHAVRNGMPKVMVIPLSS